MGKYSVSKNGKYLKFTCACGSEMWDNRFKKKNPKAPDLKCKDVGCTLGKNGTPNAIWIDNDTKAKLDAQYKAENKSVAKSYSKNTKASYEGNNSSNIPLSMQVAWAKDIAIYLAGAKKIKEVSEFEALYKECLTSLKDTLDVFVSGETAKVSQSVEREVEEDNLVSDIENVDEPEDVDETTDVEEKSVEDEELSFDCDDIDI